MKVTESHILIRLLEKYPIEILLAKKLAMDGIDTEAKFIESMKGNNDFSHHIKNRIQNAFRDIERSHIYDFKNIPDVFK